MFKKWATCIFKNQICCLTKKGYHVIRRSNNVWAGLGSDLVIEQTLMRSLKSTGGLTHGSGMTEEQRAIWTMSVPITTEYNNAMQ